MLPSAPSGSRSNSSIGLRVMASREAVRWSRVRGLSRSVAENCSTTSPNPWLGAISTRHSAGSEFRTTCAATVQPSECAITPAAGPNCWPAASSASMSSMTVPRRRPMKPGSESPWLGAFVEPLVATGHRLVAVDAPSHGDSDPGFMGRRRGTVMELMEALDAAGQQFGPAAGVIAHSLGCTVAAQVVRNSLPAECLVLIAPNHGFGEVVEQFSATLRLNPRTRDHLRASLEAITRKPIEEFDLEPLGADGSMPDTLVLHDRADKETPYRVGEGLAAAWPYARLVTTVGLGHQRILADAGTVAAAVGHITDRVTAREG